MAKKKKGGTPRSKARTVRAKAEIPTTVPKSSGNPEPNAKAEIPTTVPKSSGNPEPNAVWKAKIERDFFNRLSKVAYKERLKDHEVETRSISDALGPARLSFSWQSPPYLNDELKSSGALLIERARSLELTSDYVRRFLALAESNVIGAEGFRLQVKARKPDGSVDKLDSDRTEKLWADYSKARSISVNGRMNLRQIEAFVVRGLLRDGEVFIRKIRRGGPARLHFIDPEMVDRKFNREETSNANEVIMGIEVDEYGTPVAYYLLNKANTDGSHRGRDRVPASEMFHVFIPERPDQVRGVSALLSSIFALKMIDGVKEASVTNFRIGASKMGFFTQTGDGVQYEGTDGKDAEGNGIVQVAPGQFETLPAGIDFKSFDPAFPTDQFDVFLKSIIRSIASGWGISYNGLANDYSEVNYSSARIAQLEERELWKRLQMEVVDQFLNPLYEEWLRDVIENKTLPVPKEKFDKFNEKRFVGRAWQWVDPSNEVTAYVTAIENGLKSRTRVCAEQGLDFEEVMEELAQEKRLADSLGVTLGKLPTPASPGASQNGDTPNET